MEYLIKVSAVVVIFYFCYNLFLQRDTFFEQNRWFLLLGLITAFLIPYLVIPNYIEYTPIIATVTDSYTTVVTENIEEPFNILDFLSIVYIIGSLFFTIRFIVQLTSLSFIIFKNKQEKNGYYTYIKINKNVSPFSFFNWIVFNPKNFTKKELDQIITHEKVHVNQYHSIDILLTQLSCIILWFNPFIWFYNKNLKQNLEFIADKNAQSKVNCKKSYQTTLLKTSIPSHQMVLSNNFYNSLIKKRIVMLHKSKSKKINLLKYVLVIPLLALFLMSFNTEDIYIEKEVSVVESLTMDNVLNKDILESLLDESKPLIEKESVAKKPESVKPLPNSKVKKNTKKLFHVIKEKIEILIDKNTKDGRLDKIKASLGEKGITIKFKNIDRNSEGEITAIKINVTTETSNANYNVSSNTPINPIVILVTDNGKVTIGNKTIVDNENEFIVTGRVSDSNGNFLPGTTILIKDTKKGTISNFDGEYKIKAKNGDDVSFSFIGFDSKVVTIKNKEDINIVLNESENKDKTHKAKLSGTAVDTSKIIIKTDNGKDPIYVINGKVLIKKEIEEINQNQIESITVLKGKAAESVYGDKGKDGVVMIQKKKDSKIIFDLDSDKENKPLFIIDGEEHKKKKIKSLNPDNIKEIRVLKGESAIEKYGDKGENGVIEITTKKK